MHELFLYKGDYFDHFQVYFENVSERPKAVQRRSFLWNKDPTGLALKAVATLDEFVLRLNSLINGKDDTGNSQSNAHHSGVSRATNSSTDVYNYSNDECSDG